MEQRLKKGDVEKNIAKSVSKPQNANRRKKKKSNDVLILALGILLGIILGVLLTVIVLDKGVNNNINMNNNGNDVEQQGQEISTLDEMLEAEGSVIKTPVIDLYYPEKWEEKIHIVHVEGDVYTVQFIGMIDGKEEVHLFDIVFGEIDGVFLGTVDEIEVHLVYADIKFDDSWTEEEQNEIYAMQEDVNYIIGMLQKEVGFKSAQ